MVMVLAANAHSQALRPPTRQPVSSGEITAAAASSAFRASYVAAALAAKRSMAWASAPGVTDRPRLAYSAQILAKLIPQVLCNHAAVDNALGPICEPAAPRASEVCSR